MLVLNIYEPNGRGSKYMKKKMVELKEIGKPTFIAVDFNSFLSASKRTSGQKSATSKHIDVKEQNQPEGILHRHMYIYLSQLPVPMVMPNA